MNRILDRSISKVNKLNTTYLKLISLFLIPLSVLLEHEIF